MRAISNERYLGLTVWTVTTGTKDGHIEEMAAAAGTTNPAAALTEIALTCSSRALFVPLDVLPHLRDDRTLRALRDAINKVSRHKGTLVLIDSRDDLPPS